MRQYCLGIHQDVNNGGDSFYLNLTDGILNLDNWTDQDWSDFWNRTSPAELYKLSETLQRIADLLQQKRMVTK